MRLKFVLAEKDRKGEGGIDSIASTATVRDVAQRLCKEQITFLMVHKPDTNPVEYVGVVSERDILRLCCSDDGFLSRPVTDIMTRDMVIAKTSDDVNHVVNVMRKKEIHHIIVISDTDDPTIVGCLSIHDILNSEVDEKTVQIHHLSDFLGGTYGNQVF